VRGINYKSGFCLPKWHRGGRDNSLFYNRIRLEGKNSANFFKKGIDKDDDSDILVIVEIGQV